jgi:hypothetical protein
MAGGSNLHLLVHRSECYATDITICDTAISQCMACCYHSFATISMSAFFILQGLKSVQLLLSRVRDTYWELIV